MQNTHNRTGSALALLVILLPVVLAISAYAINVVYLELARTQLQINTDVATRAAGRVLAVTGDKNQSIAAAQRMLQRNTYVNQHLEIGEENVIFGASTRSSTADRYDFTPSNRPNAVRLETGGRVNIPMLFPTVGMPISFRPLKQAISTQSELDIVLVIDRSGSMAFGSHEIAGNYLPYGAPSGWTFGDPVPLFSRWNDASKAVEHFLGYLGTTVHNERVGLTTYADTALNDHSLTSDYTQIQHGLSAYALQFNGGSTNISDGILRGAAVLSETRFARPWATRIMIVLTDGIWTSGIDPTVVAQTVADQDVIIYTVTFSAEADQETMSKIASIGRGQHLHASDGASLANAFETIARKLPILLTH